MISRAPSFASSDGDSRGSSPTPTANRFSICSPISADGGLFAFRRTPLFRCSDGSSYRYPGYLRGTGLAWIRRDGRFARRDTENDWLFTISGRLNQSPNHSPTAALPVSLSLSWPACQ